MRGTGLIAILFLCIATHATSATPSGNSGSEGDWQMPAKDYADTRFSALAEINTANATQLHPAWTFSTGVLGGHEGQPLVIDNTMYVVTPWPNVLYAFDLTQDGYPLRWKYRPNVSFNAIGQACCDSINRGASFADGKIVYNLLDGHTVAVDAKSGRQLWNTKIANVADGETTTMAPLVAKDRVIVGVSGGEAGVFGWVKGLDLATGKVVWTAHNLGSDADMLINSQTFRPPYVSGVDLGIKTWSGDSWKHGGAPAWGWMSYDPDLDLIYYGSGNAAPYNPEQRTGDNKWANSVLARRPEDGTLIWAYQFTPHDNWDYDSTGTMILADLTIGGKPVKALVHFDKNGFAYTLDRASGRVLVAEEFAPQVNWASGVDLSTGRPEFNPAKQTGASKGNVENICPSLEGAVSPSSPAAYSPHTHLFYTSVNNFCMDWQAWNISYMRGTPFIGANYPYHAGPGGHLGEFIAWDAATGRKVWEDNEPFPSWSGALVTAGDVAFYGTLDGWFKAVDAKTGKLLYKFKVGSGVVGSPITYRGPDGKQYVAVYAGIGGDPALFSGDLMSNNPADIRGKADFNPDMARHTSQGGIIWIFGL
jgi:lanthanide-dependent methanol dehydrogenase